jgi:hypothetical protein
VSKPVDLDEHLEDVQVGEVDDYHAELNKLPSNMIGWYHVSDGKHGVFSYFGSETAACFFRLALINARLNDIAKKAWK